MAHGSPKAGVCEPGIAHFTLLNTGRKGVEPLAAFGIGSEIRKSSVCEPNDADNLGCGSIQTGRRA